MAKSPIFVLNTIHLSTILPRKQVNSNKFDYSSIVRIKSLFFRIKKHIPLEGQRGNPKIIYVRAYIFIIYNNHCFNRTLFLSENIVNL